MRIRVLSDLHLEFGPVELPPVESDLVVLAGDIDVNRQGLKWALANFPKTPVVYVLGNHEYFGQTYPSLLEKLQTEARGTNVHILENGAVTVNGLRILGSTLWTDFGLFGEPERAGREAAAKMTDYRRIRCAPGYRRLKGLDTARFHSKSVGWIREDTSANGATRRLVVSHHAPSIQSLKPGSETDVLSAAYASDLSDLASECKIDVWIHGHTHWNCDYLLGKTRVLSNQRGYVDSPAAGFRPDLVIEL